MQLTKNQDPLDSYVNIAELIHQLQNGRVILERFKPEIKNSLGDSNAVDNCVSENNDPNETSDEFFFQEPEKKTALKISNPYCSKCNKTVENVMRKVKACTDCGTLLLYKCMKCNKQYSNYYSIVYHSKSSCFSEMKYRCDKCDYSTAVKYLLKKHAKVHKFNPRRRIKLCLKCGNKYKLLSKHNKICRSNKNVMVEKKNRDDNINAQYNDDEKTNRKLTVASSIKKKQNIETTKMTNDIDSSDSINKIKTSKLVKRFCKKCKSVKIVKHPTLWHNCQDCGKDLFFQCWKCQKLYGSYKGLQYHLSSTCEPGPSYHCTSCDYVTTVNSLLQAHVKRKHKDENSSRLEQCSKCGQLYKNAATLKVHLRFCGKEPNFFCTHCPYKTLYRQNLRSHLRFAHKELNKKFMNNIIKMNNHNIIEEKKAKYFNPLKDIILQNAGASKIVKFQCLHCDETINCKNNNVKHCPKCETLLLMQCKKCNKICLSFYSLVAHLRKLHNMKLLEKPTKCSKCNKDGFLTRESFLHHMKYCQVLPHLQCKHCPYKTNYKFNLTSHLKRVHLEINNKVILKENDGNNQIQKPDLSQREEKIQQNKGFMHLIRSYCSKCNETRLSYRRMKCHVCSTTLSFTCTHCDRDACSHVKLYKRKFQYSCSSCSKAFESLMLARKHEKHCTMKTRYKCQYCNFNSKFKANTQRHEGKMHKK